jgi:hypothetical protein
MIQTKRTENKQTGNKQTENKQIENKKTNAGRTVCSNMCIGHINQDSLLKGGVEPQSIGPYPSTASSPIHHIPS